MTGSQIKQEAPGTNTFKMAEIEADDQSAWSGLSNKWNYCLPVVSQY